MSDTAIVVGIAIGILLVVAMTWERGVTAEKDHRESKS